MYSPADFALQHPGRAGEEPELVDASAAAPRSSVSPSGLPVSLHSTCTISSARSSIASAILSSASLPLLRAWCRPRLERRGGGGVRPVDVLGAGHRRRA